MFNEVSESDFESISQRMMILDKAHEALYPLNVGLLFFNDAPDRFIPYCQIDVVQFVSDNKGSDKLMEKIFKGPLDQQINDVLRFIKNVIIQEQVNKLPNRANAERYFNYPFAALEEAIVNAVYHRDYQIREPIEISIFSDRINILSFPGPDRSIKLDDLHHGEIVARRYRNRRLGEFLKELKLTEGRSTGIPKIKRSLQVNGSPVPIFDTDEERSYFVTTIKIHAAFLNHGADHGINHGAVGSIIIDDLGQKILKLLYAKKALTKADILKFLGYTQHTSTTKTAFSMLLNNKLIQYTIPDKPKSKNQQYIITKLGITILGKETP